MQQQANKRINILFEFSSAEVKGIKESKRKDIALVYASFRARSVFVIYFFRGLMKVPTVFTGRCQKWFGFLATLEMTKGYKTRKHFFHQCINV